MNSSPETIWDALFATPVFTHAKAKSGAVGPDLLRDLASIVKHVGQGDATLEEEGKRRFSEFFAGTSLDAQCDATYDTAPASDVTYPDLGEHGAPEKVCPAGRVSPLNHARQQAAAVSAAAMSERFLFDVKRNGYIECDDDGEWDADVTVKRTFEEHWQSQFADDEEGKKLAAEFLAGIRRFSRRGYFPQSGEPLVKSKGIVYFNEYRRPSLMPYAGDWSLYEQLTLHLAGGNTSYQAYLLDQLAMPLQSLSKFGKPLKTGIILTLFPAQGSGKQLLCEALFQMYGESNCAVLDQDRLDSKFTGILKNKLLVNLNETMSDTNRSRETANRLKAMATDDRLSGESKHVEAGTIINTFNLLNCTNDPRPLILEKGDRRNVLFFQDKPLDRDLGRRIAEDRRGPQSQLAAFFAHLLDRKVQAKVGQLLETDARSRLLRDCESSDLKFWREVQEMGWLSVASTWTSAARRDEARIAAFEYEERTWIAAEVMREVYGDWCRRHGLKTTGGNKLTDALQEVIPSAAAGRPRQGGVQVRGWAGIPMNASDDDIVAGALEPPVPPPPVDDGDFSSFVTQLQA